LLSLKPKNENIVNRKVLKEKLVKNNINNKPSPLKDHNIKDNTISIPLKDKTQNKTINTTTNKNTNNNNNNNNNNNKNAESKLDPSMVVLIEGNRIKNGVLKKIKTNEEINDNNNELKNKKIKIEKIDDKKSLLNNENNNKPLQTSTKINKAKNDQKSALVKPSILKKKDDNTTKRKEKVTFDDNVKSIDDNSVIIISSPSSDSKIAKNNDTLTKINELSPIKPNNDIIVPFIRLDSLESTSSTLSANTISDEIDSNKLTRKSSDLSDKSLELLAEFNRGGGKVQLSDILESLNCKGHLKSSTPNNFNRTLLFLEESPINYTRILNEEMNFHTPLSSSVKSPEKERFTSYRFGF